MKARKMLALVLALVITLGMMPAVAFATPADSFHDVDGHWAEEAIDRWSDYGIIEGYEGAFDPNGELTRGQLAAIIARLLNLPEAEANSFTDVDGHWAEDVISRCAEAGIMLGADGKARPDDKVTREETMVMLGRALGIEPADEETISHYPDAHHVSSWAEGYVAALTDKGIVNGIGGELQPGADINRASTVTILHRAIDTYANESGQKVEASGTGIVLVAAENVTVTGEADAVVVAQGAAGGKTTIEDAKVKEVTVTAGNTEVVLTGKTEAESVKVAETATAAKVEVTETAKVETVKTEAEKTEVEVSGTVSNVEVAGTATEAKVEVTETAKVETVKTEAEKTEVAVSGTVSKVEVSDTAANTKVEAAAGSTITNVDNKAEGTTVAGDGKVENVTTSGNNTTVETGGTKVEATEGTTGTTAGGNKVESGEATTTTPTTPSTPSTGGSSKPSHSHTWGAWTSNGDGTHTRVCGGNSAHTETVSCTATPASITGVGNETQTCTECNAVIAEYYNGLVSQGGIVLLEDLDDIKSITNNTEYVSYKIKDANQTFDASEWPTVNLYGNFDGNGATFNKLDAALFRTVGSRGDEVNTYTISNININASIRGGSVAALIRNATSKLVIDNVDVSGIIEGSAGAASYIVFGPGNNSDKAWSAVPFDVTFKDCISDATIIATGDQAVGFIKHPFSNDDSRVIRIENSAYIGKMFATGNSVENNNKFKYFTGNSNYGKAVVEYSDDFIANYNPANLYASVISEGNNLWIGNYPTNAGGANAKPDYYRPGDESDNKYLIPIVNFDITATTAGSIITVDQASGAAMAIASLEIAPNDSNGKGSYLGVYETEEMTLSDGKFSTVEKIKRFDITINDADKETGEYGTVYNVKHSKNGTTHNGANVRVIQYNSIGEVINITVLKIEAPTTPK